MKNIRVEGVVPNDYPDFADAYVSYAEHNDGKEYTDKELDKLNEDNPGIAQSHAFEELL